MPESITLKGKSFILKGTMPKIGDVAPDCVLTNENLEEIKLSSYQGKSILLLSVPSLDTPVCSKEVHRFNQELGRFGEELIAFAISMDLPFAQKRWCGAEDVDNLITLSDYKKRDFGEQYGVLIPDLGLLARSIFILDGDRRVQYVYLVREISEEPNYEEILDELSMRVK